MVKGRFMGRFVIVAYKPKPGREAALLTAVEKHLNVLKQENLVTDHPASVMKSSEGVIVEVFEWASAAAIEAAHVSPAVGALWAEFSACCDYLPLNQLPESSRMFAEFDAV